MQRGNRLAFGSLKSAAKTAEERVQESDTVPREQFRASAGIRVSGKGGQKFELPEGPPQGAGEAKPQSAPAEERQQVPLISTSTGVAAGLWGRFRSWFARK